MLIMVDTMADHATGTLVATNLLNELISVDLSAYIDAEHEDSLGIYVSLTIEEASVSVVR